MMNLSEYLTSIKMDLGIYGLSLPITNLDEELHKVLKLKTIKTYSQFFPQTYTMEFRLDELDVIHQSYAKTTFVLPDLFAGRHIVSVRDVHPGKLNQGAGYMHPDLIPGDNFYEGVMLGHAQAHLTSAVSPPFTFEFEHPNIVHVYNFASYSKDVTLIIDVEHFDNLSSIPPSQWESFSELGMLDIQAFLYGMLKHYTNLSTVHGTIDLKIDDWADAKNNRKTLIEQWTSVYHLEGQAIYFA